ncbi:uncharacterized protein LOC144127522 isoform X2 [Amblyomma americanum]
MSDKTDPDPEAAGLTSNPVSEIDDRQESFAESVDNLGAPPSPSERTGIQHAGGGSGDSSASGDSGRGNKPQFYIEVDASAMVNLKAGTQYTLVPLDSEQATAAAVNSIPTADIQTSQAVPWPRTMDGRLPGEESNGHPREAVVVSKEEIPGDAFGLEQSMMGPFEAVTVAVSKAEEQETSLETNFENADCSGGEKEMTYTPLLSVAQQPQQQQQQPQTHDAAGAAAAGQMSPPMYVAAPQHQAPYLVHQRATWAPYPGTSNTQAAYLPLPASSHAAGAAGGSAANLGAGPSTSVASAAAGTEGTLHAALGGDDVTAAATGADGANNDIMGVARVANMGQMQHMVGPLDNVPYYMPFNGRENHNEKERKRRTRIKNACQTLRALVPGLSEKTDKATVFEFTVQYLLHLRRHLGSKHDKCIFMASLGLSSSGFPTLVHRHMDLHAFTTHPFPTPSSSPLRRGSGVHGA